MGNLCESDDKEVAEVMTEPQRVKVVKKRPQHDDRKVGDSIGNEVNTKWYTVDPSMDLVQIKHKTGESGILGIQLVW